MKQKNDLQAVGPFTQMLTMDGLAYQGHLRDDEMATLSQAGILLEKDRIRSIGPWEEVRGLSDTWTEIAYPSVAMPGWIDAHTHLCFAGSRAEDYALRLQGFSYQEISARGGGILETVHQTRRASKEELKTDMKNRLKQLLSQGITTCEVKSGYGLTINDEVKILQSIQEVSHEQPIELVSTCLAAHVKPEEFTNNADYLSFLSHSLLPEVKKQKLAKRVDIFIDSEAFSPQEAFPFLKNAKEMGFSICLHAEQFSEGGAQLAADMRAVSADHLEVIRIANANLLKIAQVIPIVLPGASLGLGLPFAPAKMLLDHQLSLVIASDWNPGSAPMGNLLTQAALLGAAEHLTHAETFSAVTYRAARALELYDRGILRPGMRADMVIFPTSDYREILYHQGSLKPNMTFVGGRHYLS